MELLTAMWIENKYLMSITEGSQDPLYIMFNVEARKVRTWDKVYRCWGEASAHPSPIVALPNPNQEGNSLSDRPPKYYLASGDLKSAS